MARTMKILFLLVASVGLNEALAAPDTGSADEKLKKIEASLNSVATIQSLFPQRKKNASSENPTSLREKMHIGRPIASDTLTHTKTSLR